MKQLAQEVIDATEKYVPRMCWSNAVEALLSSGHQALEGAIYIEGWAIADGIVFEHGWLELADGNVLDLTWLDGGEHYFAGVEYSADELNTLDPDFLPIIWTTGGWGGMQNESYKRAYLEALNTVELIGASI